MVTMSKKSTIRRRRDGGGMVVEIGDCGDGWAEDDENDEHDDDGDDGFIF